MLESESEFVWRDAERTIVFRAGAAEEAPELLAERGFERFELLTTQNGIGYAPLVLPERALAVHMVPPGQVPDAAASVLEHLGEAACLVALGGGRVIDTAKAIGAVRGLPVAALPTTLSGAEMTSIHRLPAGHRGAATIRPQLVIADPGPMTGLPEQRLRASAMNALAHGIEALYGPGANPVASLAALRGAELIAAALDHGLDPVARRELALGSLLCAYALESAGLALHHVICQTLVRTMELPHAETNAAVLPHAVEAMLDRAPAEIASLARALGTRPPLIAERLEDLMGGPRRLGELGADEGLLGEALDAMLARPQLARMPSPPGRSELEAIVRAAW